MAEKENKRKCFKCGRSPAVDNIKLFRYMKPAVRNILRCTLWAKYLFPAQEQYTSVAFQLKLHNEHRMLCENHFHDSDFTDATKKKLTRTAVPCDTDQVSIDMPSFTQLNITNDEQPNSPLSDSSENLESDKEWRRQYVKCTKYMRQVCKLRNQYKKLKDSVQLDILIDNNSVKKLSKKITPTIALLLQGRIRHLKKKATGYRWTKQEKITALPFYKRSPTCYRLLKRLFHLPSPGTLKVLLNRVPFAVGIDQPVLKVVSHCIKMRIASDNAFVLMFEEMSLKKHVMYNTKEDLIEGYQDHGMQGRSSVIVSSALVFMIVGISDRVKQPIAHYFSSEFSTADRLAVLIKEVLNQCFQAGINISATVCDMSGVNKRALSILGANVEDPCIKIQNKEIVTLFDSSHLLNSFRNLFIKYDIQYKRNISSGTEIETGVAKWSHIKEFFEVDHGNPMFVFAPVLTTAHIDPDTKHKMRVELAAQVFSHKVAVGIHAKIASGELTAEAAVTANVVSNMERLFDCLNSDTADQRRDNIHVRNMTRKSPHIKVFSDMKLFFNTMKFVGCPRRPPLQDGWIWTMNGVERLFKKISKAHHIKSLTTRQLQKNPIKNYFRCIRSNCGNKKPTTGQFVDGLKTSILNGLAHTRETGSDELDSNVIINNLDKFPQSTLVHADPEFLAISELPDIDLIEQNIGKDSPEVQACAYVCGFLLEKLPLNSCKNCRKCFVSDKVDKSYLFAQCHEYNDFKKSLNLASKDMIAFVGHCAFSINTYLKENGHTSSLKQNLTENIKKSISFDFVKNCTIHGDRNISILINSVFIVCVNRFCIVRNRLFDEEAKVLADYKTKINMQK